MTPFVHPRDGVVQVLVKERSNRLLKFGMTQNVLLLDGVALERKLKLIGCKLIILTMLLWKMICKTLRVVLKKRRNHFTDTGILHNFNLWPSQIQLGTLTRVTHSKIGILPTEPIYKCTLMAPMLCIKLAKSWKMTLSIHKQTKNKLRKNLESHLDSTISPKATSK